MNIWHSTFCQVFNVTNCFYWLPQKIRRLGFGRKWSAIIFFMTGGIYLILDYDLKFEKCLPSLPFFSEASRDKAPWGCCWGSSGFPPETEVGWPEFKLSLEALLVGAENLLWCIVERPRLSVLKRDTKDVLFLKL